MGYSLDSLPDAAVTKGTALSASVSTSAGNHIVRVKSWGKHTVCVTDVAVTVAASTGPTTPPVTSLIPPNAISSGNLMGNNLWKCTHDSATSGSSTGGITYPVTVDGYEDVQKFQVANYSNHGGERCSIDFVKDNTTHNYIYDVWVELPNPSLLANLELDMNQVIPNGETEIFAFQCSSYAKKWEYSYVSGGSVHWAPSTLPCNVETWTANTWHHIQIYTSRDDSGNTTYHWVAFDGVVANINITTFQALALGWSKGDTVVNFQLDPSQASGAPVVVYSHDLTVYRW
jgi:hypothetical protein